jgi:hypothetical protein
MGKFTVLIFGIALLLIFSPTLVYYVMIKIYPTIPSVQAQIVSVFPFILGIILLSVQKIIQKPK